MEEQQALGLRRERLGQLLKPLTTKASGLMVFSKQKPLGAVAAFLILAVVVTAAAAPAIAPSDPLQVRNEKRLVPPGIEFPLGTDSFGRDVLSRVIFGARIALWVGIVSVGMGTAMGTAIGVVSGYLGGRTDLVIQRFVDIVMAFPALILALTINSALGISITNAMIAIGIVMTPQMSRVVRSTVLSVKESQYIEAARAIGCYGWQVVLRHLLPNVTAPILIMVTAGLGQAILTEATLSFLGLGTPPPTPSWGADLSGPGRTFFESAPWLAISPGVAISLTVLSFNLLGDALRDVWDPRLRAGH